MKDFSYITNSHPEFIENLYRDFVNDPSTVDPELRKFFEGFDFAINNSSSPAASSTASSNGHAAVVSNSPSSTNGSSDESWRKELGAYRMILGYRNKGHLIAKTNPIRERKDRNANLTLAFFGLA